MEGVVFDYGDEFSCFSTQSGLFKLHKILLGLFIEDHEMHKGYQSNSEAGMQSFGSVCKPSAKVSAMPGIPKR